MEVTRERASTPGRAVGIAHAVGHLDATDESRVHPFVRLDARVAAQEVVNRDVNRDPHPDRLHREEREQKRDGGAPYRSSGMEPQRRVQEYPARAGRDGGCAHSAQLVAAAIQHDAEQRVEHDHERGDPNGAGPFSHAEDHDGQPDGGRDQEIRPDANLTCRAEDAIQQASDAGCPDVVQHLRDGDVEPVVADQARTTEVPHVRAVRRHMHRPANPRRSPAYATRPRLRRRPRPNDACPARAPREHRQTPGHIPC